jgi:hypothetical protein
MSFDDRLPKARGMLKGKVKDTTVPSKRNPRIQFMDGDEIRKSDGKWMEKHRLVDRDKDLYRERVVDSLNGEVVHECDEPLTSHTGHGSAKTGKAEPSASADG